MKSQPHPHPRHDPVSSGANSPAGDQSFNTRNASILVVRAWGYLHLFSSCHNRTPWLHKLDRERVYLDSWFQGVSPSLWGNCSSQCLGKLTTWQLQSRSRVTNCMLSQPSPLYKVQNPNPGNGDTRTIGGFPQFG